MIWLKAKARTEHRLTRAITIIALTTERSPDNGNVAPGRINTGPEYLTIFNGQTGAAMITVPYKPDRISTSAPVNNRASRR